MKKLFQISLIVIFVFVLLQATVGGPMVSAGELGSRAANDTFLTADTPAADVYAKACSGKKFVVCTQVGWNS